MYRNNLGKGDLPINTIDFNSLRKNNALSFSFNKEGILSISDHPNPTLIILGIFSLVHSPLESIDFDFGSFLFEPIPK